MHLWTTIIQKLKRWFSKNKSLYLDTSYVKCDGETISILCTEATLTYPVGTSLHAIRPDLRWMVSDWMELNGLLDINPLVRKKYGVTDANDKTIYVWDDGQSNEDF